MVLVIMQNITCDITKELKQYIEKVPYSYLKRQATLSSILYNPFKGETELLATHKFQRFLFKNKEGFTTQCMIRFVSKSTPTLMFINGIGTSIGGGSLYTFAVPMYEKNYNVVIIENTTSGEWIHRNRSQKRLIASGYEAGWDIYLTIEALNKKLATKLPAPYHLIGLSLGGSDAIFASYFDSILKTKFIKSIMAWSSPSDRYEGFKNFFNLDGLLGKYKQILLNKIYNMGYETFLSNNTKNPYDILNESKNPRLILEKVYLHNSCNYFKKKRHHFVKEGAHPKKIHLTHNQNIDNIKNFLSIFSLDHYLQKINQPILCIHSLDDPIINYRRVYNDIVNKQHLKKISLLSLEYGGHIGFPLAYSKNWVTEIISKYVNHYHDS
jgi:predicted alpha/beta-fold hydrolase